MYKTGSLAGLQNHHKTVSVQGIKAVSLNHLRRKACMPIMYHKVRIDVLSSYFVNTAAVRERRQLSSQLEFRHHFSRLYVVQLATLHKASRATYLTFHT